MNRHRLLLLAGVSAVAAMLAARFSGESTPLPPPLVAVMPAPVESPPPPAPPASGRESKPAPAPTPAPSRPDLRTAGSPLAAELNAPAFDARHDVATLHAILRQYLRILHGRRGPPIGNDSDLARALGGHNPMKLVILPPTHPALSPDGRLRDRWGSPYFLHPRGNLAFEIRSAGPDRKLFTADDLIENPGGGHTDLSDVPPEPEPTAP